MSKRGQNSVEIRGNQFELSVNFIRNNFLINCFMLLSTLLTDPILYLRIIIIVIISICLHELAHGWMALKQGRLEAYLTRFSQMI
jgi:hypothetical protein